MQQETVKVGVVGCGNISNAYFGTNAKFNFFDIVACADLFPAAAKAKAEQWNIPRACTVDEIMADPEIDVLISLTIPQAHAPIMKQGLENGKSVYTEKPFTVTRAEAKEVIALANERGLRVGSAPDTFLGGGHQTARKLIDDGAIGEPIGATAFMLSHGPEGWHPSPEFFYKVGGGPMFDMGPYYLTDLVQLLGPVRAVSGFARISSAQREIGSEPLKGKMIDVEIPTHIAGTMQFHSGAIATLAMSFDVWQHSLPRIEIYGTQGTLSVPDPNILGGKVVLHRPGKDDLEVPLTHGYAENARGVGMADMAKAIRSGRDHRCNERLAYHVLDLMHAFHDSSDQARHIELESTCERPAALPTGLKDGELDD